jgi:hypothetical protein
VVLTVTDARLRITTEAAWPADRTPTDPVVAALAEVVTSLAAQP